MYKRKIIYQGVNSGFPWLVKLQVTFIFCFNLYFLPSCLPSFFASMTVYNFLDKK